jgi:hypothetical protein
MTASNHPSPHEPSLHDTVVLNRQAGCVITSSYEQHENSAPPTLQGASTPLHQSILQAAPAGPTHKHMRKTLANAQATPFHRLSYQHDRMTVSNHS